QKMKDMDKLKDFINIGISVTAMIFLFCCQGNNMHTNKNVITFRDDNDTIRVTNEEFDLKAGRNNFSLKITNNKKWSKIQCMQNSQIIINFQDILNLVAYPLEVFNSSSINIYT